MTSQEYFDLVDDEKYPDDVLVPRGDESFTNDAGTIVNLCSSRKQKFGHVAMIFSRHGSVRSNHYHLTDWHYMYVLEGSLWYYWRKAGSDSNGSKDGSKPPTFDMRIVRSGQVVFTPPLVEHACFFPKDTTMVVASRNVRDHINHENDLVRVKFIESVHYDGDKNNWKINIV
jgi:hypothetical protein